MSHSYLQMQRWDSDVPLVWLSHILPYCKSSKNNYTPELASLGTYAIDTLLSSALLACPILGYTFEWKWWQEPIEGESIDIRRLRILRRFTPFPAVLLRETYQQSRPFNSKVFSALTR
ncbi:hypothetical protein M405DRAFT_399754 [Rhizopogon salebrosus TDB-379]|nr:hypothetical protein M405DRAFT_399754 [Rhizopogon salebrosus TDB-379]